MLTKDITYTDIDDQPQTETFWFQLTKAEVTKNMMIGGSNGETFQERLTRLSSMTEEDMKNGKGKEVMDTFEDILKASVGKRDGKLFRKTKEIRDHFEFSGAYDAFFMEMLTSKDSGASYIRAILPADVRSSVDEALADRVETAESDRDGMVLTGTIEEVAKPSGPTPFPQGLEKAIEHNQGSGAGTYVWQTEKRYPTDDELKQMGNPELLAAFKAKSDKAFG